MPSEVACDEFDGACADPLLADEVWPEGVDAWWEGTANSDMGGDGCW